jgi:hypothetical protein
MVPEFAKLVSLAFIVTVVILVSVLLGGIGLNKLLDGAPPEPKLIQYIPNPKPVDIDGFGILNNIGNNHALPVYTTKLWVSTSSFLFPNSSIE